VILGLGWSKYNICRDGVAVGKGISQIVVFSIGNVKYGVDTSHVHVISLEESVDLVPLMPSYVTGIINMRGSIMPVLCVREFLGLVRKEDREDVRVIFFSIDGLQAGIVVDEVDGVFNTIGDDIYLPSDLNTQEYVVGLCSIDGNLVTILNLYKMFTN